MEKAGRLSAFRGCMLGGAIGDALGYPVEFMGWRQISQKYGPGGIRAPEKDPEEGLAIVSDDTQMTLFTANGLMVSDAINATLLGRAKPIKCVYNAYRDWYRCQCSARTPADSRSWLSTLPGMHACRAPGNTCLNALGSGKAGSTRAPVNGSKGCGGIMRVAPVALWNRGRMSAEAIDLLGAEAAALTHGHPLGWMPAAALVDLVSRAAFAEAPGDLYDDAAACRRTMASIFGGNPYLDDLLRFIDLPVALSRNGEPDVDNIRAIGGGWTGEEALGIALYCCLKYQGDFSRAVVAAVNHSGDSDSTGAIAGNLMGARLGEAAIEARWLEGLELRDVILEIAGDLHSGNARDRDWVRKYRRK